MPKKPLADVSNLDTSFGDDAGSPMASRKSDPELAKRAKKYQKISQLEHVLLRPDSYVGSTNFTENTSMWVVNPETGKMILREIRYVPGLYKIFDEILVNASDNKQRDASMNTLKVEVRDKVATQRAGARADTACAHWR